MSTKAFGKGHRIGQYVLKRALGAGGNGQVFLVWKITAAEEPLPFALKCNRSHQAKDEVAGRRCVQEGRLVMRLGTHPNIVQVVDVDVFEGMPFIVMQYIDGADLELLLSAARRRGQGLSLPASFNILASMASGLHHAHCGATRDGQRVGIVHRDIKPANVLITRDGITMLTDFGIGATLEDGTTGNHLRGTSRYMSPEHLRCEVRPEMDIYSFGVVAWEMFENRVYREECRGMEHYQWIMDGHVPPMLNPDTPKQLVALIESCLDPNPGQRPTALDILQTLSRCPGYTRDPEFVVQELVSVRGTRRSSGASQQELAATPELMATFAALGRPWASEGPVQTPPEPDTDDNDSDCVTIARPLPIFERKEHEATPGGTSEIESAEPEQPPEPTVLEAEPDAPRSFRRPRANRVRELSKTVELRASVGVPADARAERAKTPPAVAALGEDEEMHVIAQGNTAPGPVGGAKEGEARSTVDVEARTTADVEARPIAGVETRPTVDIEAHPNEGARAPSALRSFVAPVLVGLVASIVAAVLTAQQLGARDDEPRVMASATPSMMHETMRKPEAGTLATMETEPKGSTGPARLPAVPATEDALASSIALESPTEPVAERPTQLAPSDAVANPAPEPPPPEQPPPDAVPEHPDMATAAASAPSSSAPAPSPTKPSPPATLTLTLFLLDAAEVQVGRKTQQVSRRTEIEVPAGTHRVRWRLPGEDYWRDAGRKKFAAGHSYLVRVRASTAPEIIDANGGRP